MKIPADEMVKFRSFLYWHVRKMQCALSMNIWAMQKAEGLNDAGYCLDNICVDHPEQPRRRGKRRR